jgi:hypothetical protein
MVYSEAFVLRNSDLNKFLFADVGSEPNGMTLSVVSLLARLGHDPWREAGQLATFWRKSSMWTWPVGTICRAENCTTALA